MNGPVCFLNRHLTNLNPGSSALGLRIWTLAGVAILITQLTEPLADPTALQIAVFWSGRVLAVLVSFAAAEGLAARYLNGRFESPDWLKPVVICTLIATIGMTVVEVALERAVPQRAEYDDELLLKTHPLLAVVVEYLTIVSVLMPINLVLWLLIDKRRDDDGPGKVEPVVVPSTAEPEFLNKTVGIKAEEVIALGAEEHYVRVYSEARTELVHYRFSDAANEMPADYGTRVHRSWWVADRYVTAARRKTRRWELSLNGGLQVPVSDSFVRVARQRGFLKRRNPGSDQD